MNCDTGELRKFGNADELKDLMDEGFTRLPEHLQEAGNRMMKRSEGKRVFVSLTSGGKLSKFAAKERKKKRKAEKAARRNGRKK